MPNKQPILKTIHNSGQLHNTLHNITKCFITLHNSTTITYNTLFNLHRTCSNVTNFNKHIRSCYKRLQNIYKTLQHTNLQQCTIPWHMLCQLFPSFTKAHKIVQNGYTTLQQFFYNNYTKKNFTQRSTILQIFTILSKTLQYFHLFNIHRLYRTLHIL